MSFNACNSQQANYIVYTTHLLPVEVNQNNYRILIIYYDTTILARKRDYGDKLAILAAAVG